MNVSEIIGKWPSREVLAREVGRRRCTIDAWVSRREIPPAVHYKLVQSAKRRGIKGVTFDVLAALNGKAK